MKWFACSLLFIVILQSCKTNAPALFSRKTLHEQYGQKLSQAGLENTALGRRWFSAAGNALANPVAVSLPYRVRGYFSADKPSALGLKFSAKRGQKLLFNTSKNPSSGFTLYIDLWKVDDQNKPSHIISFDTTQKDFNYEVEADETFILRIQPELLQSGEYNFSISLSPSLSFPVAGKAAKIISYWGADRDAGARRHEGVDISSPRGTPLIAAADGRITSVSENKLGGKVIFLRPDNKDYSVYYAHLDKQLVEAGQRVSVGDTIGLVGNTGNAITTSPHLHFGIYTMGGAIDPLVFIQPGIKEAGAVVIGVDKIQSPMRTTASRELISADGSSATVMPANLFLQPLAASPRDVIVELPNGINAVVPIQYVKSAREVLKTSITKASNYLLDAPNSLAARKLVLPTATSLKVYAYYDSFVYVKAANGEEGWVSESALK